MRIRAIICALWYGVLPWQLYERECHYRGMTYGEHLLLNLRLAVTWATWSETEDDREFERTVNGAQKRSGSP